MRTYSDRIKYWEKQLEKINKEKDPNEFSRISNKILELQKRIKDSNKLEVWHIVIGCILTAAVASMKLFK